MVNHGLLKSSGSALELESPFLGLKCCRGRLDWLLLGGKNQLNVRRGGEERVDSSVGPVDPSPVLRSLVHLDMGNHQRLGVQVLELSVSLCVLQETQQEFTGLLGPAALRHTMLLGLGMTTNSSGMDAERDSVLVLDNVAEEFLRLGQRQTTDGSRSLTSVLEVGAEPGALGTSGGLRVNLDRILTHHSITQLPLSLLLHNTPLHKAPQPNPSSLGTCHIILWDPLPPHILLPHWVCDPLPPHSLRIFCMTPPLGRGFRRGGGAWGEISRSCRNWNE